MSEVMDEDRFAFLAHRLAAVIGTVIILPTAIYWFMMAIGNFGTFKAYFYAMENMLPSQFFYYNFASPILTYWLNKIVISYDRFGQKTMLPMNGILIFFSFLLIGCQVIYIVFKG
tara:strand:+ start:193 stop:537 length:345 start_codon:yes stop_codon:yes gene_type:complete